MAKSDSALKDWLCVGRRPLGLLNPKEDILRCPHSRINSKWRLNDSATQKKLINVGFYASTQPTHFKAHLSS
jgi:hypothetical protein